MKNISRLIAVLAVLASGSASSACAVTSGTTSDPVPASCSTPAVSVSGSAPTIALLDGVTASDTSPASEQARRATLGKVLTAGAAMNARLMIETIGSAPASADLALEADLVGSGPNHLLQQENLACTNDTAAATLRRLGSHPVPGGTDVLSAISDLESHLTGLRHGPIDVVAMSSMLNKTSVLDLAGASTLATPPGVLIDRLEREGLVPSCAGWNVYVVGAGSASLGDEQQVELARFWRAFFARCGGRLIEWTSTLAEFPVAQAEPPPLEIKTIVHRRHRIVLITLRGDVLFASGSARLGPSTGPLLGELLKLLMFTYPKGAITITGYTDDVPVDIPGGNDALSRERATSVVDWLCGHGVARSRLRAIGKGAASPVATETTAAGRQANRRVVVSIALPVGVA